MTTHVSEPSAAGQPTTTRDQRIDSVITVLGVAFVATTIALSSLNARKGSDLDWSNYLLGIGGTLLLLGIAFGAHTFVVDQVRKSEIVVWAGSIAAVGAGSMIGIGLDDNAATGYVAGLAMVALSAAGYYFVKRDHFVATGVIGAFLVYTNIIDDVFDVGGTDDKNFAMKISLIVVAFALALTVAGRFLPTRNVSGVVAGAIAIFGNLMVLAMVVAVEWFGELLMGLQGEESKPKDNPLDNDVYVILALTALLIAVWAVMAVQTDLVGYRWLIIAACVSTVPLATVVLAVQRPSWWGVVFGVVGAGVLAVAAKRSLTTTS